MIHIINLYKRELKRKEIILFIIILFLFSSGKRIGRQFPDDIKIYEIYKSINLEFGLDIYSYYMYANGEKKKKKRNIGFLLSTGKRIYRVFPDDIKIYEIFSHLI